MQLNIRLLILACALALPGVPSVAATQAGATVNENSIKRYMFSMQAFGAVEAEFGKLKVVFANAPKAPAAGHTTRATGTGPSGFPVQYVIDHTGGSFHVYAERRRPQHPVGPVPYVSQDVVFDTPDPDVSPVGTLTYPKSGGPFPAVVLVAGSGAHDRDAGMDLHKTLLVLADHLTRKGFAVLRYDKRGVGLTGGQLHPLPTTDDYTADALAAVRFLKLQPNINPAQIGIMGHSEGGIVAPMAAAEAPQDVRFIVMLAGTGLPGLEVKTLQDAAGRRSRGMSETLILLNQNFERELFEIAASKRTHADALAAMRAVITALPTETKSALNIPPEGIPDVAFEELLSPWYRRFFALDPRPYLEKVTCPVLALVGEKDQQVPPTENLKEIARVLKAAAPHTTVRQLPDLNHAFQSAKTGKISEYLLIEETVAPSALALISDWMQKVVRDEKLALRPLGSQAR
jgi:pimeloyl-ACP methyl ester carboxylesterase